MSTELINGVAIALLTAIDNEDWDSLSKLLHDDTVYEVTGFPRFKGRHAVMDYYENIRPIASGQDTIDKTVLDEQGGVIMGRFVGEKKDGSKIDVLFADDLELQDFKITKRRVYFCQPQN